MVDVRMRSTMLCMVAMLWGRVVSDGAEDGTRDGGSSCGVSKGDSGKLRRETFPESHVNGRCARTIEKAYDSSGTRARAFELDVDPFDRDNWILWSKTSTGCGG